MVIPKEGLVEPGEVTVTQNKLSGNYLEVGSCVWLEGLVEAKARTRVLRLVVRMRLSLPWKMEVNDDFVCGQFPQPRVRPQTWWRTMVGRVGHSQEGHGG